MRLRRIIPITLLAAMVGACGGGNKRAEEFRASHEAWLMSLNDSVDSLHREAETLNLRIDESHRAVDSLLAGFTRVDDSRLVEGFTVLNGWERAFPLKSTGLLARILEDESIELVAALKGGNFSRITVSDGAGSASTANVPYDSGLNYRFEGLNTVAFTGAEADTVAMFVADHANVPLTVSFEGYGKPMKWRLPANEAQMVAQTWGLVAEHRHAIDLERQAPLIQQKIRIFEAKAKSPESNKTEK